MITTSDDIILYDGSIEIYSAPDLVCIPNYDTELETATVEVSVRDGSGNHIRYYTFYITKTEIDAQTVVATDNAAAWMEAVEKSVKDKLESLNPSATFTIV